MAEQESDWVSGVNEYKHARAVFRRWIVLMCIGLNCNVVGLLMLWNRDALIARIKVITAEAESKLYSVQSRLDQVQSQATTEQQRLTAEIKMAQQATKQITVERDGLISKIDLLTNVNKREIVDWELC